MSNPWGVKLRKTGLNEIRSTAAADSIAKLESSQASLQDAAQQNLEKMNEYKDRQASLAANAMAGLQGKNDNFGVLGGRKSRRRSRKTKRSKKQSRRRSRTYSKRR
jgi:hypothetical protein